MTQQEINANLLLNIERFVDAIAKHKDFLDTIQPIASDVLDLYKLKTEIPIEIGIFSYGSRYPSEDNPKEVERTVYYPAELLLYPIDGTDDSTPKLRFKHHDSYQHEIHEIRSENTLMKWIQVFNSFKRSDSGPLKLFAYILNDGQDLCIKGITRCYLTFKNKEGKKWIDYLRE
jgi:hypothetical protein